MASTNGAAFSGGQRLLRRRTLDEVRLAWRLMRDPRVSALKFAIPAFLLAYLASPIDAIPDLLLGIGQADDAGVAVVAIMLLLRAIPMLAPTNVVRDHVRDMGLDAPAEDLAVTRADTVIDARFSVRR